MPELHLYRVGEDMRLSAPTIDKTPFTVGRAEDNDWVLPRDEEVSRRHFAIEEVKGRWFLCDRSGQGTEVNGKLEKSIELIEGSAITLAKRWRIFFRMAARPSAEPTKRAEGASTPVGGGVRLFVRPAKEPEQCLPFPDGATLVVGRGEECDARVEDPKMSNKHVQLKRAGNSIEVKDLGSKNGTFHGSLEINAGRLILGDPIRVGSTILVVYDPDRYAAGFGGMLSCSPVMFRFFEQIERIAPRPHNVVLLGETGSGKELSARAIHDRSTRAGKAFVAVNCAAQTAELFESEFFGHVKGAFTGADSKRRGFFEKADGGTLFLDEIGELPLPMQAKLLRALDNGEIREVGGDEPKRVDVRVIAATNRNLQREIKAANFREDLYHRLAHIELSLPPLRERPDDIKLLAEHFLAKLGWGCNVVLTTGALGRLMAHDWPGNVRELSNVISRAAALRRGPSIEATDIDLIAAKKRESVPELIDIRGKDFEELTREIFRRTLAVHGGNLSAAAAALEVGRSTITRHLTPYAGTETPAAASLPSSAEKRPPPRAV